MSINYAEFSQRLADLSKRGIKLSDDEKQLYDEIGQYIFGKSEIIPTKIRELSLEQADRFLGLLNQDFTYDRMDSGPRHNWATMYKLIQEVSDEKDKIRAAESKAHSEKVIADWMKIKPKYPEMKPSSPPRPSSPPPPSPLPPTRKLLRLSSDRFEIPKKEKVKEEDPIQQYNDKVMSLLKARQTKLSNKLSDKKNKPNKLQKRYDAVSKLIEIAKETINDSKGKQPIDIQQIRDELVKNKQYKKGLSLTSSGKFGRLKSSKLANTLEEIKKIPKPGAPRKRTPRGSE
ncbi:MAG: hypothetical protein ACHQJ6_04455 [Candidatus Berkiellales bacterium]